MGDWLTAGQAADVLGVDKRTVLRFARDGRLRSRRTPGGQHRFRRVDVERLAAGEASAFSTSDSAVQSKREEVQLLNLEVQKRLAKRNLARVEAEDAGIENEARAQVLERQDKEAQARAARAAEAERQARAAKRRQARESWYPSPAQSVPDDAPPEVRAAALRYLREAFAQLPDEYWDGDFPDPDPVDLVRAAVEKAVAPWERRKEIEKIIEEVPSSLPWQCRSILPSSPTEWERRARLKARKAIAALPENCELDELRYAAEEAVRRVGAEYQRGQAEKQHRDQIESVLSWLSGDERQAVRNALTELPVGCGLGEMNRAKERTLGPIRAAERAKRRETEAAKQVEWKKESDRIQAQVQAQLARSRAENEADRLLRYVSEYIDELCDEDDEIDLDTFERWSLADRIKNQLRPKFIEVLLRGELDDDTAHELIEEAVDQEF